MRTAAGHSRPPAVLTPGERFYLDGSSNDTRLTIGVGGTVDVPSMECTDGPGATADLHIHGAGARLRVSGRLWLGGDEAFVGGPTSVLVENGGSIEPSFNSMSIRVRSPATLEIRGGGAVDSPSPMTVEGVVRALGGTLVSTGYLDVLGSGRVETAIALPMRIRSTVATSRLVALASTNPGIAASDGSAFAGTLDVGANSVRLVDSNGVAFGDSTLLAGGTLRIDGGGTVPAGRFRLGPGRVDTATLANAGAIEVGRGLATGTLTCTGNLALAATSSLGLVVDRAAPTWQFPCNFGEWG